MKKIFLLLIALCNLVTLAAQTNDSIIERNVTVEREFQPVIQDAGKIFATPTVYTPTLTKHQVTYTDFSKPLDTDYNINQLGFANTKFLTPQNNNGFLRGGVGVWNSLADFHYRMSDKQDIIFDVDINHLGVWGKKCLSKSSAAINFDKIFTNTNLFFGIGADNTYFNRYGRYQNDSIPPLKTLKNDTTYIGNYWNIDTKIGIRSVPMATTNYLLQTGYESYSTNFGITEHQIRSIGKLDWEKDDSRFGINIMAQNLFYQSTDSTKKNSYHILKLEPHYAYNGTRFNIHAGVNLDFSFNRGQLFYPSPNVNFELKIAPKWLALYGGAIGEYKVNTLETALRENRFLKPDEYFSERLSAYTPVDAFLGLKVRPHANLLINIYADYNYTIDQYYFVADTLGYFTTINANSTNLRIGGVVNYHYQDIVNVSLGGCYNTGNAKDQEYVWDRYQWEINLSAQVKITDRLSVYTDNYFKSKRYANTKNGAVELQPVIDLNLGAQYLFNNQLAAFAKLNNFINNKYHEFYNYQVQGINFLLGASWTF